MQVSTPDMTITACPNAVWDLARDLNEVLLAAGARVSPDAGKRLARLSEELREAGPARP
jgi:hypothetical protein